MHSTVQTSEETPKGKKKLSDEAIRAKKFARTLKQVKRAVLEVQLILLDGVETDAQLHAAGALLTQSEYGDVVTERAIVKLCGFTRCGNALTAENTRKGRYRISLSAKKVYDLQEASQFCCSDCLIASREFRNNLPPERDALTSHETATEILKLVRGSQYPRPRVTRTRPPKDTRSSKREALKDIRPGETAVHPNINQSPTDFGDAHKEGNDKDCDLATSSSNPKFWNPQGEASDNLASSTRENSYCVQSGKKIMHPGEVKTSALNSSNLGLRSVNDEHGRIATSSSNFDLTSTLMTSSAKGDHGDITSSRSDLTATNTRILLPQTLAHSKEKSAPVEIRKKSPRTSLDIQERAHDVKVLPIFDYSGHSDAIEGYVPVKSRSLSASGAEQPVDVTVSTNQAKDVGGEFASTSGGKQVPTKLGNKFKRTEALKEASEPIQVGSETDKTPTNGGEVCKEWAGLVSVDAVSSSVNACVDIGEEHDIGCPSSSSSNLIITGEYKDSANLKPALKKQVGRQNYGRNVSWLDQNVDQVDSLTEGTRTKEKDAPVSKKVASTKKKVKSTRVKPALSNMNASISSTSAPEEPLLDLVKAAESESTSVNRESSKQAVEEQESNKALESNLETARAVRLASAEAIAAALTKAATAAAAGEINGIDAVANAGIAILSASHNSNSTTLAIAGEGKEENIDMSEDREEGGLHDDELYKRALRASGGDPRWPRTRTIDDEDEDGDDDDNEYGDEGFEGAREVGFNPVPKGFRAEVSMFGTMYMALERWISAATVAHIYGKEPHEEDMFLSVDGREYGWQVVIGDGVSAEILRTFSLCLSRAIPEVVRVLRLPVPMSTLEQALGRLVKTFSFVDPLPPFGTKHWRMVALLLFDALSVRKLLLLGAHLSNNRAVFRKVLETTGRSEAEYDTFRDLVLPLGRLPSFSMLSGG